MDSDQKIPVLSTVKFPTLQTARIVTGYELESRTQMDDMLRILGLLEKYFPIGTLVFALGRSGPDSVTNLDGVNSNCLKYRLPTDDEVAIFKMLYPKIFGSN